MMMSFQLMAMSRKKEIMKILMRREMEKMLTRMMMMMTRMTMIK